MREGIMYGKIGVVALLAGAVGLAGCGTIQSVINGDTSLTTLETQVQADAANLCGFLPLAEDIAQIIKENDPALQTPTSIANLICQAVTSAPTTKGKFKLLAPGGNPVILVNGLPFVVHGTETK